VRRTGTVLTHRHVKNVVLQVACFAALTAALPVQSSRADEPAPAPAAPSAAPSNATAPVASTAAHAEESWHYLERGLQFFPEGPGKGKDRLSIGGLWQIAPMFTMNYERGLGSGFSWDAALETIIIYNQLGVGAQWSAPAGPFSLGLMLHFNAFYGVLGKAVIATTSFDASGWGLLLDPGVKAGLQIAKDSWLTLQMEFYLSLYQSQKLGTLTISPNAASYAGFGLTLAVEYAPKMDGVIYYGVSLYHTAANYPMWMNVEATPESEPFTPAMIWYIGLLAGYEF
jgi:hypothetical protein